MACRHAAHTRPIAIVPGLNHAQQSNGEVNAARGDVVAEQPQSVGAAAIAALRTASEATGALATTIGGTTSGAQGSVSDAFAASTVCVALANGGPKPAE